MIRPRWVLLVCVLSHLSAVLPAHGRVRNHKIEGEHELSGGIGFNASLSAYGPGGFAWFNEYGYHLKGIVWLNLQLNVIAGETRGHCKYQSNKWSCDDKYYAEGGTGLESIAGVKLKWRLRKIPLQFHAKFGGGPMLVWWGDFYGAVVALKGGGGARYFVVPTLGVGMEITTAFGPAFYRYDLGTRFYGALAMNLGVEWRF
jgi:hypothetical protein